MGTLKPSDDELMRDHIYNELSTFENIELLINGSPFLFFVGITHRESIFINHDINRILWKGMRKSLIYYFAPEGFQSRYIDEHYTVYNEYRDGKWCISVNCGDKIEISLYHEDRKVFLLFSTPDYFEKDFKQVWKEYLLQKKK